MSQFNTISQTGILTLTKRDYFQVIYKQCSKYTVHTQGSQIISVTATPKSQHSPALQLFSWGSQRQSLTGCLVNHFPFFLVVLYPAFPSLPQLSPYDSAVAQVFERSDVHACLWAPRLPLLLVLKQHGLRQSRTILMPLMTELLTRNSS